MVKRQQGHCPHLQGGHLAFRVPEGRSGKVRRQRSESVMLGVCIYERAAVTGDDWAQAMAVWTRKGQAPRDPGVRSGTL